jgi:hypothetical protein
MGRFFFLKRTFLLSLILLALAVAQQRQNTTSGTDIIGEEDARRMSEEQQERQRQQAEARKRRRQREKEREGQLAAKQTLQLASSEACDWKSSPLALVKGHICGVHYKVLGLDRSRPVDKADVKKAYRQKSLALHPDKNNAPDAATAFKIVQDAYECLVSDECKETYDEQLRLSEQQISWEREQLKSQLARASLHALSQLHYYLSVAANHVYQAGLDIWDLAGEVEMNIMGAPRPVGRVVLAALLALKARYLLKLHGLAYVIMRCNFELAKARGVF